MMTMKFAVGFIFVNLSLAIGNYIPYWLVRVDDQPIGKIANEIAQEIDGMINEGQVGEISDVYRFHYSHGIDNVEYTDITCKLQRYNKVIHVEQEETLNHDLREFTLPTDPYWKFQWPWYDTADVEHDINVVPVWINNITGYGTTALIIDNGVQLDHPDLEDNIDESLCYSVVTNSSNINPIESFPNYGHGTSCAGEIAMVHDNGVCGAGVAYNARIGGFQMNFTRKSQCDDIRAFSFKSDQIQVSSNSWGPSDNGYTVDGPTKMTQHALKTGVTKGRDGLGTIYVFSAGNGGLKDDSCAADGYASSIYTIAIGSVDQNGDKPIYEETCSAKLAVAYSFLSRDLSVVSTWPESKCIKNFTGTSAACPLVSGIILLALEVNPQLSWRDIQYLIVYTSKTSNLEGLFDVNGANLRFNDDFGFGAIDAEALVNRARYWTPVGPAINLTHTVHNISVIVDRSIPFNKEFNISFASGTHFLEHVVLTTTFSIKADPCYNESDIKYIKHTGPRRGEASITLTSPSGTSSVLLPTRNNDFVSCTGYTNWPFMSVHYWGEDPNGTWSVNMEFDNPSDGQAVLESMFITLYMLQSLPEDIGNKCDPLCATPTGCSYGNGSQYCDACRDGYYRNATTLECVSSCPSDACTIEDICVFYNGTCPTTSSNKLTKIEIIIVSVASGITGLVLFSILLMTILCCICCRRSKGEEFDELINK